jgi:hypothetical protein
MDYELRFPVLSFQVLTTNPGDDQTKALGNSFQIYIQRPGNPARWMEESK